MKMRKMNENDIKQKSNVNHIINVIYLLSNTVVIINHFFPSFVV